MDSLDFLIIYNPVNLSKYFKEKQILHFFNQNPHFFGRNATHSRPFMKALVQFYRICRDLADWHTLK
ncbi:hypothetical protein BpHYR1_026063 [Brachionus plicatilis]|uniref:Uncharacterized protein n=1 Tax=Brachionus plicatilis TaxID=10195 RepID=A0A3M7Q528_BRAPC|nr:hypothetical protein BpHYR1_026063 [Brachionus plicatilis]